MIYNTPSRAGIDFFKPFTVRLLVDVRGTQFRKGDLIKVEEAPNGFRFIDLEGKICSSMVKESIDYELI